MIVMNLIVQKVLNFKEKMKNMNWKLSNKIKRNRRIMY